MYKDKREKEKYISGADNIVAVTIVKLAEKLIKDCFSATTRHQQRNYFLASPTNTTIYNILCL